MAFMLVNACPRRLYTEMGSANVVLPSVHTSSLKNPGFHGENEAKKLWAKLLRGHQESFRGGLNDWNSLRSKLPKRAVDPVLGIVATTLRPEDSNVFDGDDGEFVAGRENTSSMLDDKTVTSITCSPEYPRSSGGKFC